jgi:hypothetical protein
MEALPEQDAAAEYLRRTRARDSLVEYSQAIDVPGVPLLDAEDEEDPDTGKLKNRFETQPIHYTPVESRIALHHLLLMQKLQKCIETPRGRLMVFMPPGSAKSTYASVVAPAWIMNKKKNTQIILGSYASTIAAKQSRKVRAICRDPKQISLWQDRPQLLDDQRAVDDWQLSNGSSMMAAGLLAGITGNRADGIIIDDPVANREQADSPGIREKIYNEFLDTALTRAKPKMWAIIIQTRWHEEDLAGSILPADYNGESGSIACRDGQTWEVLCIPAESEREDDVLGRKPGEFLWPEWFPREHWSTWRDNPRAARTWAALYQQRPAPFTGVHFNREMFLRYDPDLARV